MFNKLGKILGSRFNRAGELSKQLEIVKAFDLCRAEIGEAGEPIMLRNQILTVRVVSSAGATELRYRESVVMAAINQAMGKEIIRRIVYRVG